MALKMFFMDLDLPLEEYEKGIGVIRKNICRLVLLLVLKILIYIILILFTIILPSILMGRILRRINHISWLRSLSLLAFSGVFFFLVNIPDETLQKCSFLKKTMNILDSNFLNGIKEMSQFFKGFKYMLWVRRKNILLNGEERSNIIFHRRFPSKKMLLKQKRKEDELNLGNANKNN